MIASKRQLFDAECPALFPPETIMDLSFALQALSLKYLVENNGKLENKVYSGFISQEVEKAVSALVMT